MDLTLNQSWPVTRTSLKEYVSRDILEEGFVRALAPLRRVQVALGTARVRVRGRFVSPPTRAARLLSAAAALLALPAHGYVALHYARKYEAHPDIKYAYALLLTFNYVSFLANMIHVRFLNSEANCNLYVEMQRVERALAAGAAERGALAASGARAAWATCAVCGALAGAVLAALRPRAPLALAYLAVLYCVLCGAIEWMHCASLLTYFDLRLQYINTIMLNHLAAESGRRPAAAGAAHRFASCPLDRHLEALFDTFSRFQALYRFQLLLFCCYFYALTLISFEVILLSLQKGLLRSETMMEFAELPTLTALHVAVAGAVGARCDGVRARAARVRRAAAAVWSRHARPDSAPGQRARRVWRAAEARPPLVSVYGAWLMGGGAVLALLHAVTALMLALLQFAVL